MWFFPCFPPFHKLDKSKDNSDKKSVSKATTANSSAISMVVEQAHVVNFSYEKYLTALLMPYVINHKSQTFEGKENGKEETKPFMLNWRSPLPLLSPATAR